VMRSRIALAAALAFSLAVGGCSDDSPTSANTAPEGQQQGPELATQSSTLLKNLPFANAPLTTTAGAAAGVTSGTVTITRFDYDRATRTLLVSGSITYTNPATGAQLTETFEREEATLRRVGGPTSPVCEILELDIGPIHLDLLGLVIDIAPIRIDITAESGPGNLLGNLLCALAGLLDPGPGPLAAIIRLLNQINAILAGL